MYILHIISISYSGSITKYLISLNIYLYYCAHYYLYLIAASNINSMMNSVLSLCGPVGTFILFALTSCSFYIPEIVGMFIFFNAAELSKSNREKIYTGDKHRIN